MLTSKLWVTLPKVTLHYGHPLTEITGKSREEVIVKKGSTLSRLLKNLVTKYGYGFKDHVFSDYERNQVKEGIIISLNAKHVSNEIEKIKIEDDVFIGIFRPAAGG
jgi:molybdopterin converting factor small subunit